MGELRLISSELQQWIREAKQGHGVGKKVEILVEKLHENYEAEYQAHLDFNIEKPLVQYSFVEEDHRRRGVGTLMYTEFAKRFQSQGFPGLYASSMQTEFSFGAWNFFERSEWVETGIHKSPKGDVTRRFLSV